MEKLVVDPAPEAPDTSAEVGAESPPGGAQAEASPTAGEKSPAMEEDDDEVWTSIYEIYPVADAPEAKKGSYWKVSMNDKKKMCCFYTGPPMSGQQIRWCNPGEIIGPTLRATMGYGFLTLFMREGWVNVWKRGAYFAKPCTADGTILHDQVRRAKREPAGA